MAEPGPVDAPCDLGAWRELYAKLNVPWRDPATGAVESAPRRSTPAFAPPVTAPQAPPADGWRDDGAVESAFDSLIGADSEQREAADAILCRRRRTTPALLYAATDSRDGATAPAPEPQPAPAPSAEPEPEPLEAAPEPAPQPEEHGLQPRPSQISYETYSEDFAASAPASAPASAAPTPRGRGFRAEEAPGRRSSAEQSLREPLPDPDPEPEPEPEREPEPGPVSWEAWTPAPAPYPMPAFYWLMRREYEGDHAAPASTNSPGRGLVAAVARRAFHPEELPEMALHPGERLLILRDEYDPSPGWIFAAKGTSNAGYVPRNYLDIDDGPAE